MTRTYDDPFGSLEYTPDGTETRLQIVNAGAWAARGRNPDVNVTRLATVIEEYLQKWDAAKSVPIPPHAAGEEDLAPAISNEQLLAASQAAPETDMPVWVERVIGVAREFAERYPQSTNNRAIVWLVDRVAKLEQYLAAYQEAHRQNIETIDEQERDLDVANKIAREAESLEDERDRAQDYIEYCDRMLLSLRRQLAASRASAARDTRRLDWLSARAGDQFWVVRPSHIEGFLVYTHWHGFTDLRDAIDAAIGHAALEAYQAALARAAEGEHAA